MENEEKYVKTAIGLSKIMITSITKIVYLYIRQKMCFLQIFGTKTKAKKSHNMEIQNTTVQKYAQQ